MVLFIKLSKNLFLRLGILLLIWSSIRIHAQAQCDFVNNITGVTMATLPTGDAANATLYTQIYALVNMSGNLVATSSTPNFSNVAAGRYHIYAVNYRNTEAASVTPLLAIGQAWAAVVAYGDDATKCLDYTTTEYSSCPVVVCRDTTVCLFSPWLRTTTSFNTAYTQNYCLVCGGTVVATSVLGAFNLSLYPTALGTNCQLFAINYNGSAPVAVGTSWTTFRNAVCAGSTCADYVGYRLNITPLSQTNGNGISTTTAITDITDGCAGAVPDANNGASQTVSANNWCVPSYSGIIQARPIQEDDLAAHMSSLSLGSFSRVPCVGAMDLTQHTIFYTVECAPTASVLTVHVNNPGATITRLEAALYGPVNATCPTVVGGSFRDCDDAGAGSNSGSALRNLTLTTNALPGQVFLVIVDTEGTGAFTLNTNTVLMQSKLSKFLGRKADADNVLAWEMSSEIDMHHFVLERSDDGSNFEELAAIPARGGNNAQSYEYIDPRMPMGAKYYRLRMTTVDGATEYSNVEVLSREESSHIQGVSVFPNPNTGIFTIDFASNLEEMVDYSVLDILGRTIYAGQTSASIGQNRFEINIQHAPAACYIVSLSMNGHRINRRVVKS